MRASRTDSHSPNIRLRLIQTLQSSIFHCRGQTLITGETYNCPRPPAGMQKCHIRWPDEVSESFKEFVQREQFSWVIGKPNVCWSGHSFLSVCVSLEQDWINTATFLFYGEHFCPNLVCGQLILSSDWPQCKWPTSVCRELIQLLSEPLPFHYNAIIAYCTIHRALGILQMRF